MKFLFWKILKLIKQVVNVPNNVIVSIVLVLRQDLNVLLYVNVYLVSIIKKN